MNILITGATGLIGRALTKQLKREHQLTILTRDIDSARSVLGSNMVFWSTLDDRQSLDGIDAVINLAGEPIADKRWSDSHKTLLCHSRWDLTEKLSMLITQSSTPPHTFLSSSAVGFYGRQGDLTIEEDDLPHDEFTHQLCARWEALALQAQSDKTRVCLLRTGIVLDAQGGALAKMLPPYRLGAGGPAGSGTQYMPWIHIDDMVAAIYFLLANPTLQGPFNMTAPYPARNYDFSETLARVLHKPHIMKIPALALNLSMGEMAVLILSGQKAVPAKLEKAGFEFKFTDLQAALADLLPQQ
ncbi:MAG: TIGR01777 family oxidoreductase [Plesiomonas sp.]|uniref:TIGR01777 family oxidoreductase n=1 Tax=Plesiomonas sp. TaxID=2486279 RepID=UPI003F32811D